MEVATWISVVAMGGAGDVVMWHQYLLTRWTVSLNFWSVL